MCRGGASGIARSSGWTSVIRTWLFPLGTSLRQPGFSDKLSSKVCKTVTAALASHLSSLKVRSPHQHTRDSRKRLATSHWLWQKGHVPILSQSVCPEGHEEGLTGLLPPGSCECSWWVFSQVAQEEERVGCSVDVLARMRLHYEVSFPVLENSGGGSHSDLSTEAHSQVPPSDGLCLLHEDSLNVNSLSTVNICRVPKALRFPASTVKSVSSQLGLPWLGLACLESAQSRPPQSCHLRPGYGGSRCAGPGSSGPRATCFSSFTAPLAHFTGPELSCWTSTATSSISGERLRGREAGGQWGGDHSTERGAGSWSRDSVVETSVNRSSRK